MELRGPLPFRVANAYGIAPRPAQPAAGIQALVAARVDAPTDPAFTGGVSTERSAASADVHHFYTRSADRVDAATGVALGRAIDTTA